MKTHSTSLSFGVIVQALLVVLSVSVTARAVSPTYADDDGTCNGLAPCYTAISEAVFNASDPDANLFGAAAEVFVFPGDYDEDVDLTDINGNSAVGDIHLITVDDSGTPTPGTATIQSNLRPCIHTIGAGLQNGHALIDGFIVHATNNDGISIRLAGDGTVANVTADGNGGFGVRVVADGYAEATHVSASGNQFTGISMQGFGTHVASSMSVGNGSGVSATAAGFTENVLIEDTIADENLNDGMELIASVSDVIVERCSASGNTSGIGILASALFGSARVLDTFADNNGDSGMTFNVPGPTTIERCSADGNLIGHGISVLFNLDIISVIDTSADGNGTFGMELETENEDIVVQRCSANDNINDFGLKVNAWDDATVTDTAANGNDSFGMNIQSATGSIVIQRSTANDNTNGFGITAIARALNAIINVLDTSADRNARFGINLDNLGNGRGVSVRRCSADDNSKEYGVLVNTSSNAAILDTTANRNGDFGMHVHSGGGSLTVERCSASDNLTLWGISLDTFGLAVVRHVTTTGNGENGIAIFNSSDATIEDAWTQSNAMDGIRLSGVTTGRAIRNVICENTASGLRLDSIFTLPAQANWWGDAGGPTHPNNPAGTGNEAIDSSNGAGGTIVFDPWIDTITPSADAAVAGSPSNVSFQFSDTSVFLGIGPGDPNGEAPFTLTTDNGTLTSSKGSGVMVTEFINNPDGVLTVELVPAVTGLANVTLIGPCGLNGAITINVAAPPPGQQVPDNGDMNNGSFNGNGHCGACGALGVVVFPIGVLGYAVVLLVRNNSRRRIRPGRATCRELYSTERK